MQKTSKSDTSSMVDAINGDLTVRVCEHTEQLEWTASPSGTVWRKRVHRVGPVESGQVTSVVRYEAGATFPVHDHPGGEEILVLDGVFSDEHGDWPANTYLLNPEGFRHAPFSKGGCLLLVKLRQYPGRQRIHVAMDAGASEWLAGAEAEAQVQVQPLYAQEGVVDTMRLERWIPGTVRDEIKYSQGVEIFVLEGTFHDESGRYPKGTWLRLPAGSAHTPASEGGCTLYIKEGGFAYLESARARAVVDQQ